jgi:hypothetical protein
VVDQNVTEKPPRFVASRFELAAGRMADAWLRAGRVVVSQADLQLATEFLRQAGWRVESRRAGLIRVHPRGGPERTMTAETLELLAFRRLAQRD